MKKGHECAATQSISLCQRELENFRDARSGRSGVYPRVGSSPSFGTNYKESDHKRAREESVEPGPVLARLFLLQDKSTPITTVACS